MSTVAVGVDTFAERVKLKLAVLAQRSSVAVSPTPGRTVLIAPGSTVAHDDCCDGQVWARLVNLGPLPSNDPTRRPGLHPCAMPEFLLTGEIGIVRCAATVNDNGVAPSPSQINRDGEQSIEDMSALLGVLRCTEDLRSIMNWVPTGPEGGCHGCYWTFTMLVRNCIGCEEVENP